MGTREQLNQLVRLLPEEAVETVYRFVRWLLAEGTDPVLRALALAPEDDEPGTEEEEKASEAAWEEYLQGKSRTLEEVKRELLGK